MKNTMKKLIAFASALSAAASFPAQSAFGAYEAENVAECEYDELIQMRDKNILIKDGSDTDINDDTQLIVIDDNGEKKLIDKSVGINGIYNYVSTTMGKYNYISPTLTPYSFDFKDETYRVSTEQGTVIVGIGDKFAIMNNDNEIVSAEYSNIYRINDDYFIVNEGEQGTVIDNQYVYEGTVNSKSGLIRADGTVIVEPTDGIKAFYLAGDGKHFLVTTDDGAYIIDTEGKKVSESFANVLNVEHKPDSGADNYNSFTSSNRLSDNYLLGNCGVIVTSEDGTDHYLDINLNEATKSYDDLSVCETFDNISDTYTFVGLIGQSGSKYDFIDVNCKVVVSGSDEINFNQQLNGGKYEYCITSAVGDHIQVYDLEYKLAEEYDKKDYDYEYNYGYVALSDCEGGKNITVYDKLFKNSSEVKMNFTDKDAEITDFRVNVDNRYEYDYYTDLDKSYSILSLSYTENLPDENGDDYSEYYSKTYLLTQNQKCIDVSDYPSSLNYRYSICDNNVLVGIFDYDTYSTEYTILLDESGNVIIDTDGEASISQVDDCFVISYDDSFSVADKSGKIIHENVKGHYGEGGIYYETFTDDEGKINRKYGFFTFEKGVLSDTVYDSISPLNTYFDELPDFYVVSNDGKTSIFDSEYNEVVSYNGNATFAGTPTQTPYVSYFAMNVNDNDTITSVIYDVNNKKVTYEESGLYDYIDLFKGDYALAYDYDEVEPSEDDYMHWTGENRSTRATGLIKFDGTAVIPATAGLNITFRDTTAVANSPIIREPNLIVEIGIGSKYASHYYDLGKIKFKPEDFDYTFAKKYGHIFAVKTKKDTYMVYNDFLFGITDLNGNELIKPQYVMMTQFDEGVAMVCSPDITEYTLRTYYPDGEQYDENGYASLLGLITEDGYVAIEPFNNVPESGIAVSNYESKSMPLNITGLWYEDGMYVIKKYNADGKLLTHISFTAEDITDPFIRENGYDIAIKYDNLYYVEKDGLAGVVDSSNNVIIPVEYKILSVVTTSSMAFVREQLQDILKEEFTPKLRKLEDGSYLANVKDANNKLGVIKITGSANILGDVDGDGKITSVDASAALTYYVMQPENIEDLGFPFSFEAADWDKNGIVDSRDASAILTYYATH